MNLHDYFFLFFDEDGGTGAGSGSVADDPPDTGGAGSAPGKPQLPSSKPDALSGAATGLADDLVKKGEGDNPAEPTEGENKPEGEEGEDKPEGEEGEEGEDKPEGEEEQPAEGSEDEPELTPEEREEIEAKEAELEEAEKALQVVDLWSSNITPETAAWIEDRRKQRAQERAEAETAKKLAESRGLSEEEKKELAELTQNVQPLEFNSKDNWRNISNVQDTDRFQPEYLTAEKLKTEFGIDPDRVPAKFAPLINALIARHNRLAANSSYIFKEAKAAYKDRDSAKDQLLTNEFQSAVTSAGFDYDDSVAMLKGEAKSMLHVNGKRQPWDKVIGKLAEKHKKVFSTQTPAAGSGTGGTNDPGAAASGGAPTPPATGQQPAKPAKTGTRKSDGGSPPAKKKSAKTLREASDGFAGDLAKILEKGRG